MISFKWINQLTCQYVCDLQKFEKNNLRKTNQTKMKLSRPINTRILLKISIRYVCFDEYRPSEDDDDSEKDRDNGS